MYGCPYELARKRIVSTAKSHAGARLTLLRQVSVAVLLDNFVNASAKDEAEAELRRIEEAKNYKEIRNPLEPLLIRLIKGYVDDADLTRRLGTLYHILDSDGSGGLSADEFCSAMKKLGAQIHVSRSDFCFITDNGALCDANGAIGEAEFQNIMRRQIRLYTQVL